MLDLVYNDTIPAGDASTSSSIAKWLQEYPIIILFVFAIGFIMGIYYSRFRYKHSSKKQRNCNEKENAKNNESRE